MSTPKDAAPSDGQFGFELLKLLLQVAWADDDVAPAEAETLLVFAQKRQLAPDQLQLLSDCLAGRAPLPPPNLGFLKPRRLEVMRALKELLMSDLSVAAEEEAILEQISSLLS
ncbi:MAG: TerB family tellurite resistance protein [Polyangiaceae bacterium]